MVDPADSAGGILKSRAALLQRDGDVVDLDGTSPVSFAAIEQMYYVVVRHRNHLSAMTDIPIGPFGPELISVDFTSLSQGVYGNLPSRSTVSGVMVQSAGDVSSDGTVRYIGQDNDRDEVLLAIGGSVPTNVVPGYSNADVNMDGSTKYLGGANDRDPILINIGGSTPTIIRDARLP